MSKNKEERIKEEIDRLKSAFVGVDEKDLSLIKGSIEEAGFMKATLEDLKETINSDGSTDLFIQGSSKYIRESPAMKTYNALIKNYTNIMKNIIDKFPRSDVKLPADSVIYEGIVYTSGDKFKAFIDGDDEKYELLNKLFPND